MGNMIITREIFDDEEVVVALRMPLLYITPDLNVMENFALSPISLESHSWIFKKSEILLSWLIERIGYVKKKGFTLIELLVVVAITLFDFNNRLKMSNRIWQAKYEDRFSVKPGTPFYETFGTPMALTLIIGKQKFHERFNKHGRKNCIKWMGTIYFSI